MISYDEYKNKVYEIFVSRCCSWLSREDKIKYLCDNDSLINESYNSDLYCYCNLDMKNIFSDTCIYSRICNVLEMLN